MTVELDLGATEDPRELVLGDPDALATTERRLTDLADACRRTADGLAAVQVGAWQGEAADAFRARFPDAAARWATARDAFRAAAGGWAAYRRAVARAQAGAAEAVLRYRAALAASRVAAARYSAEVERYEARARVARGNMWPEPAPLPPFADPGPAGVAAARAVLADARAERDRVARVVAAVLREAAGSAPEPPNRLWALLDNAGDLLGSQAADAGRFLGGAARGTEALVTAARSVNPGDPWNLTHPAGYLDHLSSAAAGIVTGAVRPVRVLGDLLGPGGVADPVAGLGHALPAVLATAATGGAVRGRTAEPRPGPFAEADAAAARALDEAGDGLPPAGTDLFAHEPPASPPARGPDPITEVAGPPRPTRDVEGGIVLPAGFTSASTFLEFGGRVAAGFAKAGFPDVRVIFQGSSVTGVKFTTGVPFDVGRRSDVDLAVADPRLFAAARDTGVPLRKNPPRTRPLDDTADDLLERLGLLELRRELSAERGRKVSFMIFADAGKAMGRSESIEVTHG